MEQHTPHPQEPALETGLRSLFATLLEVDENAVGNDDDFFELGGDSLLVIKLVARIRRTLNREITPGDVFDHPTVGGLTRFLQTA
ncbi:phosphopantetheine-binding protein [Paraburkholderia flava]|uniref:phosphopantetheine-binding protein n=1 Tax=Paraburkholderia flava TaxID=2547393 RepID=UPI00105C679A|nr:phosphopantetheine-binding protein [Paraburkholderia flava]